MTIRIEEPDRVHTFVLPRHLTKDQARNLFFEQIKPRALVVERFTYHPSTGLVQVTECRP